ncbi:hypothetical protein SUGI_1094390 [Cryptomeria japonica]|nr:hypothetical protein SUGI_1094390 [Cryptomeria japonica]
MAKLCHNRLTCSSGDAKAHANTFFIVARGVSWVKALVGAAIGGEEIWQNVMRHLVLTELASQILAAKMLSGNEDIRKPWDSVEDRDALILQVDMASLGKDDVKICFIPCVFFLRQVQIVVKYIEM